MNGPINISDAEMAAAGLTDQPEIETPPATPDADSPAPVSTPDPAATPAPANAPIPDPDPPHGPDPALTDALREQLEALRGDIDAIAQAVRPVVPKQATKAEKMAALKAGLEDLENSDDVRDQALAKLGLPLISEFEALDASLESRVEAVVERARAMDRDADAINDSYTKAFETFGITEKQQTAVDVWVEKNVAIAAVLQPHETIARALGLPFLVPVAAGRPSNGTPPNGAPPAEKNVAIIVGEPGKGGTPGRKSETPDYGRTPMHKVVAEQAARFGI